MVAPPLPFSALFTSLRYTPCVLDRVVDCVLDRVVDRVVFRVVDWVVDGVVLLVARGVADLLRDARLLPLLVLVAELGARQPAPRQALVPVRARQHGAVDLTATLQARG